MPNYCFVIGDGSSTFPDETGSELPDEQAASHKGACALVEMTKDLTRKNPQTSTVICDRNGSGTWFIDFR